MSKADVSIELENTVVRADEEVRGTVTITVNADVQANGVTVQLQWWTHGKGDRQSLVAATAKLPPAAWVKDQMIRFPFTLKVPRDGPFTYRGAIVSLDWLVQASVDLPWALDPTTTAGLVVHPASDIRSVRAGMRRVKLPTAKPSVAVALVLSTLGPCAGWLAWTAWSFQTDAVLQGALACAAALVAVVGGAILWRVWASSELGGADVQTVNHPTDATFRLELPQRMLSRVTAVTATIVSTETAVSGDGKDSKTRRRAVRSDAVTVTRAPSATGESFSGALRVPPDAPLSMDIRRNRVEWTLEVCAAVRGRPDPSWSVPLQVVPLPAAQLEAGTALPVSTLSGAFASGAVSSLDDTRS